eukprot:TRINITY_DN5711_c0_g1_i1.p1 TRINITY_DN5711_c0_g1~~TRINITY_DN5711_c0_g1_i1.p1  ORF type:complete len:710 (+),score=219.58 TRINITY_DN5711_c0_g1_i1:119-2248(+)
MLSALRFGIRDASVVSRTIRTSRSQRSLADGKERLKAESRTPFQDLRAYYRHQESRRFKIKSFLVGLAVGGLFLTIVLWGAGAATKAQNKAKARKKKERVVVLGSGWGGLSFVSAIDTNRYDVVVVSPREHFLFSPWLAQAAVGIVNLSSITEPISRFLQRFNPDVRYYEAICTDVDPAAHRISCQVPGSHGEFTLDYDKLVLAVGSTNKTWGIKGVDANCIFVKDIQDARRIRHRVLECFSVASSPGIDDETVSRLLRFVVVGAGPASTIFATQLKGMLNGEMKSRYPALADKVKVTFIEAGTDHIKNIYERKISHQFPPPEDVEILRDLRIKEITHDKIVLVDTDAGAGAPPAVAPSWWPFSTRAPAQDPARPPPKPEETNVPSLPYGMCVWMTGYGPNELVEKLRRQRPAVQLNKYALLTDDFLEAFGLPDVFAVGECGTIDRAELVSRWMDVFKSLDENDDGFLDPRELSLLFTKYRRQFPQLEEFASKAESLFAEGDVNHDGKLSVDEFQSILHRVDAMLTTLPATAETAIQQGRYLADSFNTRLETADVQKIFHELDLDSSGFLEALEVKEGLKKLHLPASDEEVIEFISMSDRDKDGRISEKEFVQFVLAQQKQGYEGDWKRLSRAKITPFRYQHLGGFEYVGYENSITQRGSKSESVLDGWGATWLWKSAMYSQLVSARNRVKMSLDWAVSKVVGRDVSKD